MVYKFEISLEPMAYRFEVGNRIRVAEALWSRMDRPDNIGIDTVHDCANILSHCPAGFARHPTEIARTASTLTPSEKTE